MTRPTLAATTIQAAARGNGWSTVLLAATTLQSSVSQYGITWTFDQPYPVGSYANGDPFVVGPVSITSITPESQVVTDNEDGTDRVVNGTMLNPQGSVNGFDSQSVFDLKFYPSYDDSLNQHPSRTGSPISTSEASIVSCISRQSSSYGGSDRGRISSYGVLTVIQREPRDGAFRPDPYGNGSKESEWNENDIDYTLLRNLSQVGSDVPDLNQITDKISHLWYEATSLNGGLTTAQVFRAHDYQPSYGRDIGKVSADALLSAHLDYTKEQKRPLVAAIVQQGLDVYKQQTRGAEWTNNGGHYGGQKDRMVFAAMLLNDDNIKAACDAGNTFVHGNEQQIFYVSQADVDRQSCNDNDPSSTSGNPCGTSGSTLYENGDIGLPEWGRNHYTSPCTYDCRSWGSSYRWIGSSYAGNALAVRLIPGAKDVWNWDAYFDYEDRYSEAEINGDSNQVGGTGTRGVGTGKNQIPQFVADMYTNYRSLADTIWSDN